MTNSFVQYGQAEKRRGRERKAVAVRVARRAEAAGEKELPQALAYGDTLPLPQAERKGFRLWPGGAKSGRPLVTNGRPQVYRYVNMYIGNGKERQKRGKGGKRGQKGTRGSGKIALTAAPGNKIAGGSSSRIATRRGMGVQRRYPRQTANPGFRTNVRFRFHMDIF